MEKKKNIIRLDFIYSEWIPLTYSLFHHRISMKAWIDSLDFSHLTRYPESAEFSLLSSYPKGNGTRDGIIDTMISSNLGMVYLRFCSYRGTSRSQAVSTPLGGTAVVYPGCTTSKAVLGGFTSHGQLLLCSEFIAGLRSITNLGYGFDVSTYPAVILVSTIVFAGREEGSSNLLCMGLQHRREKGFGHLVACYTSKLAPTKGHTEKLRESKGIGLSTETNDFAIRKSLRPRAGRAWQRIEHTSTRPKHQTGLRGDLRPTAQTKISLNRQTGDSKAGINQDHRNSLLRTLAQGHLQTLIHLTSSKNQNQIPVMMIFKRDPQQSATRHQVQVQITPARRRR
ncbi:hypothetical protein VP01_234g1 [Puccinia sorghi]|uniref:Uncharacterized protein n=1 Tax=Puccinia sorghi TaxID=27349 RepID=A0A0L6V967_9BASI|nr:hypothetical protein VP01_234g1 [Puccinia sorghi]